MADKLNGKRIAFRIAPEGVEQVELTEPGEVQAFNHLGEHEGQRQSVGSTAS